MARINAQVGRARTSGLSPTDAGYVAAMNRQMKVVAQNLKTATDNIKNATPEALRYGLQPIFDESQRLVPKDTLRLMRSGFLVVRKISQGASASIGYGRGGEPSYAPIVHERLDMAHASPTQAKFLEAAVKNKIHLVRPRIQRYLRKHTGLGGTSG